MAYIYMPLFFSILGFVIVYFAALPLINVTKSVGSMFISSSAPVFSNESQLSGTDAPVGEGKDDLPEDGIVYGSTFDMPTVGTLYAHISCEKWGLDAPMYFGDNDEILASGVGQYIGSSIPGCDMPIMLAGHRAMYFSALQYAEEGDVVTITTEYGIFKYKVTETKLIKATSGSAYLPLKEPGERLIMYTCYPFNSLETPVNRYYVYADKISGPTVDFGN